ncbi:hypothetical protein D9M71_256890 [compost metagenome]
MAVAEGAVLQQVVLEVDLVQLAGDVAAACTGLDQLETGLVHLDVDLPQAQVLVGAVVEEQGALQRGVVAGDHREAVEAEDVALVHLALGHRVVRAVGVDAGLEPGPGVHQLDVGEGPGDLADHRLGGVQRDFVFRHLVMQRLDHRRPADIGDARAVADHHVLFGGLDHAHTHARCGYIHQLGVRIAGGQLVAVLQVQVVMLDADAARLGQGLLDGDEVVIALPVGVDDVVGADSAAPRLATVDVGADADHVVLGDHQRVGAAEGAVEEVGVVVDVVVRGEDRSVNILRRQVRAQPGLAIGVFLGGEGGFDLVAITDAERLGHLHDGEPLLFSSDSTHRAGGPLESIATEAPRHFLYESDPKLVRSAGVAWLRSEVSLITASGGEGRRAE